jgi:predicted dehydrogenase
VPEKLAWGLIATGNIARQFAEGVNESETGRLLAAASREKERARDFAAEFGAERSYGSYEELLADPDVEAVYISTPHTLHAEWAIRAAAAGKHVLCEKPLTLSSSTAVPVIEAAKKHDVFFMEAFMYRCYPQTERLVDLIREGKIGEVRAIKATFSFTCDFDPKGRVFDKQYGGGAILDVGCYPTSMAGLIAGVAIGETFAEPLELSAHGRIGEISGVDEWAVASARFPGDILAQLSTGIQLPQDNIVQVFGTKGWLTLTSPWFGGRGRGVSTILFQEDEDLPFEEIEVPSHPNIYAIEADKVAMHITDRQVPSPGMTWEDTLANLRILDRWLSAVGMTYEER